MKPRDLVIAVAVAAAWGVNFVAIHAGLQHFPPLLFSTLRFALAAFPALLFVGRPRVAWKWLITVALVLGVAKFSLLFIGMHAGMPAGLSSLVLQSQAIFTMCFAVLFLRERPRPVQIIGLVVALGGVALVATRMTANLTAFLLVIGAAVCWGVSNVATRRASPPDSLRFMVWVSALATGPLLLLTLIVDGPSADLAALRAVDTEAVLALLYIALISTLAGFAGWGFLIRRYGTATVAPFSMLVPFFGMASAALFLGEPIHTVDVIGGALVVGGVLLGLIRVRQPRLVRVGA
ncbi:EamA family transporter [Actinoplanes couchii]|nr:EamA family transporter [Actinoplanes couchii]MDR6322594.1 O-acetylserine/cysteine efflux transporter [Actinoplanes couchii]